MSFNNGGNPPPPDVFDSWSKALLEYHREDRDRLNETRGMIPKMFQQARACLVGKNNMDLVRKVNNGSVKIIEPTPNGVKVQIQNKFVLLKLDISGWTFENNAFKEAVAVINASHSIIYDIVMDSLDKLGEAQNIAGLSSNQPLNPTQPTGMMMEDPGLLERLKGSVGSVFKPRWQKEKDKAYSMVNELFANMKESRAKWELYLSTHWDNISKAVDWQQDGNVFDFLEELEALDDCEMRTMFLIDLGYRKLNKNMMKEANSMMQAILQAKATTPPQLQIMPGNPMMTSGPQPQLPSQSVQVSKPNWE